MNPRYKQISIIIVSLLSLIIFIYFIDIHSLTKTHRLLKSEINAVKEIQHRSTKINNLNIITEIIQISKKSLVQIKTLSPQQITQKNQLKLLPIKLTIIGHYRNILIFIADIIQSKNRIMISNFQLSNQSQSILLATIEIDCYGEIIL